MGEENVWQLCGDSALLVQEIISRSTEDVDIPAMRYGGGGVDRAFPMSEALKVAAATRVNNRHVSEPTYA